MSSAERVFPHTDFLFPSQQGIIHLSTWGCFQVSDICSPALLHTLSMETFPYSPCYPGYLSRHYHGDLQSLLCLELADQLGHFGIRLGLCEHEFLKLSRSKRPLLIKNHPAWIIFQSKLAHLVHIKGLMMATIHSSQIQTKNVRSQFSGLMFPPFSKQDTTVSRNNAVMDMLFSFSSFVA